MFQIIYEYSPQQSTGETLHVIVPEIQGEIKVAPESARRRANAYLSLNVAMEFQPGEPVLIWVSNLCGACRSICISRV
jgi:hypothetical protein